MSLIQFLDTQFKPGLRLSAPDLYEPAKRAGFAYKSVARALCTLHERGVVVKVDTAPKMKGGAPMHVYTRRVEGAVVGFPFGAIKKGWAAPLFQHPAPIPNDKRIRVHKMEHCSVSEGMKYAKNVRRT